MFRLRELFSVIFLLFSFSATIGFSVSKLRRLDNNKAMEDTMLTEISESSTSERIRLDSWLNHPSAINIKSCCERVPKKYFVGQGLDGEILVDIGQCRQSCSTKRTKINRKEFEAILKANYSVDPVELFLAMQRDISPKSCGDDSHCLPTRTVVERHMTMSGMQEVAVIEDCSCLSDPELCHRVEERAIHFPGTPFETSVDVGRCSGPCSSGNSLRCRSTRNKTVAIAGPNGDTCVEVIDKCGCASSCYRASSMEHIYDFVSSMDDETTDSPVIKVVDVGKCVGECNTSHHKEHCVLRDKDDSSKCLMSLTRRENNCVPLGFQLHHFRNKNGTAKSMLSITDCGCQ
ncbi:uncharacterized protein LOC116931928 [Daphnia magna]|uniref:uncharacterized protein LOC116931928 n=1 Tax=Daphnia magna TaxID=35525 RepID=UPI001E1BB3E9|nr:uncharacterized protein LOC116931928 [Daphnia magna]